MLKNVLWNDSNASCKWVVSLWSQALGLQLQLSPKSVIEFEVVKKIAFIEKGSNESSKTKVSQNL
jgi:hypothetical protein